MLSSRASLDRLALQGRGILIKVPSPPGPILSCSCFCLSLALCLLLTSLACFAVFCFNSKIVVASKRSINTSIDGRLSNYTPNIPTTEMHASTLLLLAVAAGLATAQTTTSSSTAATATGAVSGCGSQIDLYEHDSHHKQHGACD